MAGKVSIYDIAELAGITAGSVSKILNGKGSFSQETRDRVMTIAKEQGYVPSFAAKTLRDAHTHTIAIMTPDVSNDFFSSIILNVEQLLREKGYTSYICSYASDREVEESGARSLVSRQVDGFVFVGGRWALDPDELGIAAPFVSIDRPVTGDSNAVSVLTDHESMFYEITRLLLDRGCTAPAFINVSTATTDKVGTPGTKGYRRALADAGIEPRTGLVLEGAHRAPSYLEAEQLMDACLDGGEGPDGIVAVGDRVAMGAINALVKHGITPGREVLVIGTDNSLYSRIVTPAVSSVDRDIPAMAREGVTALLGLLAGEKPEHDVITVPYRVIERATTLGTQA